MMTHTDSCRAVWNDRCRAPKNTAAANALTTPIASDNPAPMTTSLRSFDYSILFLLAVGLIPMAHADDTVGDGRARPNIVLIMADDMGYECVTANGGQSYDTPNLDRLAASGVRFEHCYSQPLCTPSRVQIMTGRYNSRNYIRFGILDPRAVTFGNILRDAGYATCVVGKWQLEGGFDGPRRFGFDEYCLWQLTRRPNRYANPGLEINGKEVDFKKGQYGPDIVSDYACDFIERHARGEKPFFLYYPMILPHWPFEPTPLSADWDPTFRRHDSKEKSYHMRDRKYFIEMVHYADRIVGKIVSRLDRLGIRRNTLVLFTGDNGTYAGLKSRFRGREWIGGKGHMMDNGTRVPLIASQPGAIPAGRVCRELVDFTDFLPTLAEAAGAKIPGRLGVTGISFLPWLQGRAGTPRQFVYCWYFRDGRPVAGGKGHRAGESARTRRYKLYRTGEFYDVRHDFYETSPLKNEQLSGEQRAVKDQLRRFIERHTRRSFYSGAGG